MVALGDIFCIDCGCILLDVQETEKYMCTAIGCDMSAKKVPISIDDDFINRCCVSCGNILEPAENFRDLVNNEDYDSGEENHTRLKVGCDNYMCLSYGEPKYITGSQYEHGDDYCEVCGEPMVEYDRIDFQHPMNVYSESCCKETTYKIKKVKKENVFEPTVFLSEGL